MIDGFTPAQLVAMRFASDGELAELAQRVHGGEFASQGDIKKAIREWRPDNLRV